jgi:hypothetical protein
LLIALLTATEKFSIFASPSIRHFCRLVKKKLTKMSCAATGENIVTPNHQLKTNQHPTVLSFQGMSHETIYRTTNTAGANKEGNGSGKTCGETGRRDTHRSTMGEG